MAVLLGEYELGDVLGRGGTATVWSAVHRPSGARCAIKTLHADLHLEPTALRQMRREIRAATALAHPSVARIHDHGAVPDPSPDPLRFAANSPYVVFEELSGGDLGERRGTLPWPRLHTVVSDVLQGLAHAHARGVLHRDMKPGNVLFDRPGPEGRAVLTDFGIARVLARSDEPESTLALDYLGTPHYSPREQIVGPAADVGPWSDLYALAAMVWAMATGQPPYEGRSPVAILQKHIDGMLGPFFPVIAVPEGLETWLRTCLALEVADRFQRAPDALAAWDALDPPPPSLPRRPEVSPALRGRRSLLGLRSAPLVGRHDELAVIQEALRSVLEQRRVRVVALRGEAGVGKSRLVRHVAEGVLEEGIADVLHGDCTGRGAERGLRPALERRLRTVELPDEDVEPRLEVALADIGITDRGLLAVLLEELRPGTLEQPPDGRARRAALRALLVALAGRRPILLWLDGVHEGIDELRLLLKLVRQPAPILVLLTARSESLRPGAAAENLLGQVLEAGDHIDRTVPPLSTDDTAELVRSLVPLEPRAVDDVIARAAGVPLFAEQLVSSWMETGDVGDSQARASVPEALRELQLQRIDTVLGAAPARRVAVEIAAALGDRVEMDAWRKSCAAFGIRCPEFLPGELAERGLVSEQVYDFRFTHSLARDAVEERARAGGRWPAICLACAEALASDERPASVEQRATFLMEADRPAEAFPLALATARRARFAGRGDEAERWLDEAARCLADTAPRDPRWLRLRLDRATDRRLASDYPAALRSAQAITRDAEVAGEAELLAESLHLEGVMARMCGEPDRSIATLRRAVARYEALSDPSALADALASLAQALRLRGGHEEADTLLVRAGGLIDESNAALRARLDRLMANGSMRRGDLEDARRRLVSARAICQRLGRLHDEARTRHDLASALVGMGDYDGALTQALAMQAIAERTEHEGDADDALILLGNIHFHAGRLDEAEAAHREALAANPDLGTSAGAVCAVNIAIVLVSRGGSPEAPMLLEQATPVFAERRAPAEATFVRWLHAAACAQLDRWDQAGALIDSAGTGPAVDVDLLRGILGSVGAFAERAGHPDLAARFVHARDNLTSG